MKKEIMEKRKIINKEMQRLCNNLKIYYNAETSSRKIKDSGVKDGRKISDMLEDEIYIAVEDFYKDNDKIQVRKSFIHGDDEKIREWADFFLTISHENEVYDVPVNIKCPLLKKKNNGVSDEWQSGSASNASSNNSIFWSFFGVGSDWSSSSLWKNVKTLLNENSPEKLREMITNCDKDYYYLVVNKAYDDDVFFNSVKQLNEVNANANNLPFQIKWGKNREPISGRTNEEAYGIIFPYLLKGLKTLAERYESVEALNDIYKIK